MCVDYTVDVAVITETRIRDNFKSAHYAAAVEDTMAFSRRPGQSIGSKKPALVLVDGCPQICFKGVLGLRCFAALWLKSKVVLRKSVRHAPCASAVCLCILF